MQGRKDQSVVASWQWQTYYAIVTEGFQRGSDCHVLMILCQVKAVCNIDGTKAKV